MVFSVRLLVFYSLRKIYGLPPKKLKPLQGQHPLSRNFKALHSKEESWEAVRATLGFKANFTGFSVSFLLGQHATRILPHVDVGHVQ